MAPDWIGSYRTIVELADREHAHVVLVERQGGSEPRIARVLRGHLAARPDIAEEFLRIGQAMLRIRHPNLACVHHVGTLLGGQPYMVMDYVHGRDIGELVARPVPNQYARVADIGLQVASGLAAAHQAGLRHLDLTTTNILLVGRRDQATVQIVNFEMAAVMRRWASSASEEVPCIVGAPSYWSPERAKGGEVDARSDIYSLGIILFELLTGRVPFVSHAVDDLILEHLYAQPPVMDSIPGTYAPPEKLQSIVKRCLAKQPSDRFQTAQELKAALRPVARDAMRAFDSKHGAVGSPSPSFSGRWAWRFMMVVGACATAIALTIGLWSARERRSHRVRISVTSEPPGALVYRAGNATLLGTTPFTLHLPVSKEAVELLFQFADGHLERVRAVPVRSMHLHASALPGDTGQDGEPPGDG